MTKIYYAHPISDYSTYYERNAERQIAELLREHFGEEVWIENPNQPHHQLGYKTGSMGYFIDLCKTLDGCVFDTFPGGIIGSGVAMEVKSFLDDGKPVFQYHAGRLWLTHSLPPWVAPREITRELSRFYRMMPGGGR